MNALALPQVDPVPPANVPGSGVETPRQALKAGAQLSPTADSWASQRRVRSRSGNQPWIKVQNAWLMPKALPQAIAMLYGNMWRPISVFLRPASVKEKGNG